MDHLLESRLALQQEEPLADQRSDRRSPRLDISDDRAVVQVPYLMGLPAGPYLDPRVFRLRVDVQQQPAGTQRPMNRSQSANDALRDDSSE